MGAVSLLGPMALTTPASAVVGGVDATEKYPFVTALFDDEGVHYCGGSLIDEQWVLTAAHCSAPDLLDTESISVRVGSNNREEGGSERKVGEVVQHPDYQARDFSDDPDYPNSFLLVRKDISLLKLDSPVEQTPIRIAQDRPEAGEAVRALGPPAPGSEQADANPFTPLTGSCVRGRGRCHGVRWLSESLHR